MTENSTEDYWAQFVPKNFEMDPENDELLMGDQLRDGMVVLIEDDNSREDVSNLQKYGTAAALANAKKYNRWATVSNFRILENGDISFFAAYKDGVKKHMRHSPGYSWYVNLDSLSEIPEEDPLSQEEQDLKEAMAALTETAKHAWSDLVTILRDGFKSEQEQMDKACAKLRDYSDLKFSKKPEDLGEPKEYLLKAEVPYLRPATVQDVVRYFVRKNMDFFTSKTVHSLNEIHPMYSDYCDQVGRKPLSDTQLNKELRDYFKISREVYVEGQDSRGRPSTDVELIEFFDPYDEVEAGYSEQTNNKEN